MTDNKISTVTVARDGQLQLSCDACEALDLKDGSQLLEMVLPGCVILVTHNNHILSDALNRAASALQEAGVTVDELMATVESIKEQRLAERFPDLCHD